MSAEPALSPIAAPAMQWQGARGLAAGPGYRRLLVVDDDDLQGLVVQRIAEGCGFIVDTARDATEAVGRIATTPYHTVVLDLALGEEDGISVLRNLAASGNRGRLLLITGVEDRVRLAAFRLAQMLGIAVAGTLRKPMIGGVLRAMLQAETDTDPVRLVAAAEPIPPAALAEAMDRDEITLEYQPKVSLASGHPVGVEALARWTSPRFGRVPPDQFIPVAEQAGMIARLTGTLLRQALLAWKTWEGAYPRLSVAVNVSPEQLTMLDFPDQVADLLDRLRVPPRALVLEITESSAMSNARVAADILTRLRLKGVGLSIDDFGTGYSSMLSLLRMPFSELKIDRSFVQFCDTDHEAWKIVRASILLGHEFAMRVVAEGVETPAVRTRLADAGCDVGQGWLFARSMPDAALLEWLAARASHPAG